jgi:hypothetical protein
MTCLRRRERPTRVVRALADELLRDLDPHGPGRRERHPAPQRIHLAPLGRHIRTGPGVDAVGDGLPAARPHVTANAVLKRKRELPGCLARITGIRSRLARTAP